MMPPKISVITVTLNSDRYLEQAIESIIGQTYPHLEYIVIDGGSTDSTVDIVKQYAYRIDYFSSEPDEGIADAMNKGLRVATGDYILFLHSDDYLLDANSLALAAELAEQGTEILLFNIFLDNGKERVLARPRGLNWRMNFKTGVFHQSALCSKALFERIGNFDPRFRIAMDYDFFLRAYRAKATVLEGDFLLSVMRLCGISARLDWPSLRERFKEEQMVQRKNCPDRAWAFAYLLYWLFYLPYRRIASTLTGRGGR
ncbi:glycosyltransferase family 2 protein [Thiovibrio sp. JS02]